MHRWHGLDSLHPFCSLLHLWQAFETCARLGFGGPPAPGLVGSLDTLLILMSVLLEILRDAETCDEKWGDRSLPKQPSAFSLSWQVTLHCADLPRTEHNGG
jgi:hypothetical protein